MSDTKLAEQRHEALKALHEAVEQKDRQAEAVDVARSNLNIARAQFENADRDVEDVRARCVELRLLPESAR